MQLEDKEVGSEAPPLSTDGSAADDDAAAAAAAAPEGSLAFAKNVADSAFESGEADAATVRVFDDQSSRAAWSKPFDVEDALKLWDSLSPSATQLYRSVKAAMDVDTQLDKTPQDRIHAVASAVKTAAWTSCTVAWTTIL